MNKLFSQVSSLPPARIVHNSTDVLIADVPVHPTAACEFMYNLDPVLDQHLNTGKPSRLLPDNFPHALAADGGPCSSVQFQAPGARVAIAARRHTNTR